MREILFRGKRVDNGEWVEGFYVFVPEHYKPEMSKKSYIVSINNGLFFEVIPETVGQYTGLKDKNGKRIFEGDIVQWKDENFNNYTSVVEWCGEKWNYPAFDLAKHDYECNGLQYVHEDCIIEVIGTIYDNPELLEMKK